MKQQHIWRLFLLFPFLLFSCTALMTTTNLPLKQGFLIKIIDFNGNPIEGVVVNYKVINEVINEEQIIADSIQITKNDGIVLVSVQSKAGSFGMYRSELFYGIKKDGYYSQKGSFVSFYSKGDEKYTYKEQVSKTIILIKPIDHIKDSFLLSSQGEELKVKILGFIDALRLQSILSDSYPETQSINLIDFKENKYLTFKFVNTNSYNSLKLNKYDIGKTLFDEVIRKILNPLNENLGKSKEFYGYDLTVVGHTKSFADKYAIDQEIIYRYMIPREIVEKYKNKDISGQQVIDASIILMDDERIDLKLQ